MNSDKIVIIFILCLIQNVFADKDSNWVYTGNAKWKIDEKTTLDMEIYCMNYFNIFDNDTLIKRCTLSNSKNKSTKDSFVYASGILDLREIIYDGDIIVKDNLYAMGASSMTKYDSLGRLESVIMTLDRTGDTLETQFYVWGKDGRLLQTIFNGKTRNFIYGTPCDSVIVDPHDLYERSFSPNSFPYSRGYNKSFGMIPEKTDPEYESFKIEPYEYKDTLKVLERQKKRCEEYKKSHKRR